MEATGRAREGRNTVKGSTTDRKMRRQHARISADNLIRRLYTEIATLKWKIDSYDAWYWSWAKAKHEPNVISYNDVESCTVAVAEAKHEPNAISYNGDDPAKSCTAVVGDAKHEPNVISCNDVKSCTVATAEAKHEPNAISYNDDVDPAQSCTALVAEVKHDPNVISCNDVESCTLAVVGATHEPNAISYNDDVDPAQSCTALVAEVKHDPNVISCNDVESCTLAVVGATHEPNAISYNDDDSPRSLVRRLVAKAKHKPNVISYNDVESCTVAVAEAKHEPNAISYRDESGRSAATTKPNVDSCRPENGAQVKMEPDDFYPSYSSGTSACERGEMIEPFTSHTSRSTPSLGPGCSSYGYSAAIGPRRMQQVKLEPNIASYRDAISQELREISGTPGAPFLPSGSAVIDWGAIKNTDQDCKQM